MDDWVIILTAAPIFVQQGVLSEAIDAQRKAQRIPAKNQFQARCPYCQKIDLMQNGEFQRFCFSTRSFNQFQWIIFTLKFEIFASYSHWFEKLTFSSPPWNLAWFDGCTWAFEIVNNLAIIWNYQSQHPQIFDFYRVKIQSNACNEWIVGNSFFAPRSALDESELLEAEQVRETTASKQPW